MSDVKYLVGWAMGYNTRGNEVELPVYVEVSYANGRLSLVGNIGNDSFGQISKPDFTRFAHPWNQELAGQLWTIWDRWHLNDMRAGCEHQRNNPSWDIHKKVTVHKYGWTTDFYKMRRLAEAGKMDAESYEEYKMQAELVRECTLGLNSPKYPQNAKVQDALARGLIEEKGTEEKIANWVDYREHPDGLLSKPCPECGYKYSSQWLFEEVPSDVIQWFNDVTKQIGETD